MLAVSIVAGIEESLENPIRPNLLKSSLGLKNLGPTTPLCKTPFLVDFLTFLLTLN
jgi:hypothetical protein